MTTTMKKKRGLAPHYWENTAEKVHSACSVLLLNSNIVSHNDIPA